MSNIDIHSHILPKELVSELGLDVISSGNLYKLKMDERVIGPLPLSFFQIDARLKDLESFGIEKQVISVSHHFFYYRENIDAARKAVRKQNEAIAKLCKLHKDRFIGNAALPLQDPKSAVEELEYAYYTLELKGVEIGTNVAGKNLDSEELFSVYEKLEELQLPILVHPNDMLGADRMKKYYLPIVVGTLAETTIAIASVIFGGVLERFPDLKFIFCHGGGAAPYHLGRLERALEVREECKGNIKGKVKDYFRKLYFDTVLFSEDALKFLIQIVGSEKVVLGTDYPFEMGDWAALSKIDKLSLPKRDYDLIVLENARKLYNF
jgi:aminocarboxymuconate-semialdehyde decarboxylase